MKVFLLGGTGSIGSAVLQALRLHNHEIFALGRTPGSCQKLREAGAIPVAGDMTNPAEWIGVVDKADAVIQAAATWGDDMEKSDRVVVDAIATALANGSSQKTFIYTGGCWMYGETGDTVATEETLLNPIGSFAWAIPAMHIVLSGAVFRGMVIHPAMVYERNGGVFAQMYEDARQLAHIRVIGAESVRWPLVHRLDLAELYVLMLERGRQGSVYNAAAMEGVAIGTIARAIADSMGVKAEPVVRDIESAKSELGSSAEGYALDQQMSGKKAMTELGWRPQHLDVYTDIA
jgi:nucleoside-diphosphate-sugar epimerase